MLELLPELHLAPDRLTASLGAARTLGSSWGRDGGVEAFSAAPCPGPLSGRSGKEEEMGFLLSAYHGSGTSHTDLKPDHNFFCFVLFFFKCFH